MRRRDFLHVAAAGVGALGLASSAPAQTPPASKTDAGLPKDWRRMRKLDAHNHVFGLGARPSSNWAEVESLVEAAEALGIDKMYCSRPDTTGALTSIEIVRESNDAVLAAMKRYPQRIGGYCFVQPGNGQAALDEIDRCIDAGMVGIKLYHQFKYDDPVMFPVAEKCIQRRIPFLGHSAYLTDPRTAALQPKTSNALNFCALSRRYPELMLILGHINGGGDWEWAIKALRDCPNVYLDTSGSVQEDDTIERCVRELGVDRVLFATDLSIEGGVGKMLSAQLTPEQREAVFWRNYQRILDRRRA